MKVAKRSLSPIQTQPRKACGDEHRRSGDAAPQPQTAAEQRGNHAGDAATARHVGTERGMAVTAHYDERAFFDAWRRGVEIAGPQWFGDGTAAAAANATSKYAVAPRFDAISEAIGWLSSGEAVFLAAMYSFYNADTGGKMLRQLRVNGLADVAAKLDEPRLRVIAALLVSYAGW
jgi:hypothetical protein